MLTTIPEQDFNVKIKFEFLEYRKSSFFLSFAIPSVTLFIAFGIIHPFAHIF